MENRITSNADSVQLIYSRYLRKQFIVNRKYQRKLVWQLNEKQAFIDSLCKKYSVPLFLFANVGKTGTDRWEIIDGLQRLNAICSFIENEYPIEIDGTNYYFDLDTLADSRQLKDKKIIPQKHPILDRSICIEIVNYQLPISIIQADSKSIETVFRRINSFGKQLSEQEIRLAGAVGKFPDLVRDISSYIRGDVSNKDILLLNDMQQISISDRELKYGIKINDIFWVKNLIITKDNIRKSRDEELISQILAYILLGREIEPSKKTLDKLYQYEEDGYMVDKITDAIDKLGYDQIKQNIIQVHEIILLVANEAKEPLRTLLYGKEKIKGLFRSYQVLYLTIYELMIVDGLREVDIPKLTKFLHGIGINEFNNIGLSKDWNYKFRNQKINALKGIIQDAFTKGKHENIATQNGVQQLENLLTLSKTEGNQYDFKQTCHDLENGTFSQKLVEKIVKTLVAGANKPNSTSYVILGVADNIDSAERFKQHYNSDYKVPSSSSFFITGIQEEVRKYHDADFDKYHNRIKAVIKKCNLEKDVEFAILQNIKAITYYGYEIIIFSLKSGDTPYSYKDKYYIREGNNCKEITGAKEIAALFNLYKPTNY